MATLHEYSIKGINKRKVEAWLAVAAVAISITLSVGFRWLINREEWRWMEHYPYLFSTMTMTGLYGIVHSIYRKHLWKFTSQVPDLNGIWVGWVKPEEEGAYIAIWTVEQDWNGILADIGYFYSGFLDYDASAVSVAMIFDEASALKMDMQMMYGVTRVEAGSRMRYDGVGFCTLDMSTSDEPKYSHQISGTYFTNKPNSATSQIGTRGRFLIQHISKDMRDRDKIDDGVNKVLEKLKNKLQIKEIASQPILGK